MKLLNQRYIPPPVTEALHEITFSMTTYERLRLITIVRRGRLNGHEDDVAIANSFLHKVLGVLP